MATKKGLELIKELEQSIERLNDQSWFKEVEEELDRSIDKIDSQRIDQDKKSAQEAPF